MTDRMMLMLAAIGFVKAVAPQGRQLATALYNKTFGTKDLNMEEVFAEVDFPEESTGIATTTTGKLSPVSTRKVLKYEGWAQQQQQQQQPPQQPPQQQVQPQTTAFVATQVHNLDHQGKPPQLDDDDHDRTNNDRDEGGEQVGEALRQEDARARTELGKRHPANCPAGNSIEQQPDTTGADPLQRNDPWARERQQMKEELTNKDFVIEQFNQRLTKLESTITTAQMVDTTLMVKDISTPPIRCNATRIIDFDSIKKGICHNNNTTTTGRFVTSGGILHNDGPSPSENSTPYLAKETGSVYQLGGSGPPGGDPDWHNEDDEGTGDGDRHGRNNYHREFTLVSPNKVIIQPFSGTHLHSKPYMPFHLPL